MGWFCPRCGHVADAAGACPRHGGPLEPVSTHDLIGRRLGEYTVLGHLGGGSFGKVYRAIHARSGMLVAIKLLHRPIDHAESQRVLVEARAAAMMSHPNLVKVYDLAYASDRRPYVVMQLLEGRTLARVLAEPGARAVDTVVRIASDVLAGLASAHAAGVVHRDLKPDNIFVTAAGSAIVVDFGLAKLVADPRAPSLTMTGEAVGTPTYMAPEQIQGGAADGRADLYALGCVLFEMLIGRPPFTGTTYALFDAHLTRPPPAIAEQRPDVPVHVVDAIARALAKEPGARFADATEMRHALQRRGSHRSAPTRRRGPFVLAGVAGAGIVVAVAVARSSGGEDGAERPTDQPAARPLGERPAGSSSDNSSSTGSGRETTVATSIAIGARTDAPKPTIAREPRLDPDLERTLAQIAKVYERGDYPRSAAVAQRCELARAERLRGYPENLRAFNRRYVALIDRYFTIDVDRECGPLPSPTDARSHRYPLPPARDGEPPLDSNLEQALELVHDQLDAGRVSRSAARAMLCSVYAQKDEARREPQALYPTTRAFYRRYERLLRSYYPDLDAAECR